MLSDLTNFRGVRGAIHVHSDYSDGDADMEAIFAAALEADLDYLLITDHHQPHAARDGWHGRHGDHPLLIVVGTEFTTAERHDILAFGIHAPVATRRRPTLAALQLLHDLGAVTFVAHPQGRDFVYARVQRYAWTEWDATTYAGLEVWNYMHDWIRHLAPWRLPAMCREPEAYIHGPDPAVLTRWDEQAELRRVAGLAGLDVHGRKLPFGLHALFQWAREGILPYRHTFRALTHHALVPKTWGRESGQDARDLVDALGAARGWMCHEGLAPAAGFSFSLLVGETAYPPGTEVRYQHGCRLRAESPRPATLRLLCRGQAVDEVTGTELDMAVEQPGEYRLEAHLEGRPWILTNHIYLRAEDFRPPHAWTL